MKLDVTDLRILSALRNDANKSLKELARIADTSIPTVHNRIIRLIKLGVIKRFTIVVNTSLVTNMVTVFLALKAKVLEIQSIIQNLVDVDEITELYLTTGQYDIILKVTLPDIKDLEGFILNKLGNIKGLESIHSSFIIDSKKEQFGTPLIPGLGFEVHCNNCGKNINRGGIKKLENDHEIYFCSDVCATESNKSNSLEKRL